MCLTMDVTKIEALRRWVNRTVSDILRDRSTADAGTKEESAEDFSAAAMILYKLASVVCII